MKTTGALLVFCGLGLVAYGLQRYGLGDGSLPWMLLGSACFIFGMFMFLLDQRRRENKAMRAQISQDDFAPSFSQMRQLADEIIPMLERGDKSLAVKVVKETTGKDTVTSLKFVEDAEKLLRKMGGIKTAIPPETPQNLEPRELLVYKYLAGKLAEQYGADINTDKVAANRLQTAAKRAVLELESASETRVVLPYLMAGPEGPMHLDEPLNRQVLG